jgi:hypothetical protein
MKTLIVVVAMMAAGRAAALDPWTEQDTKREALFTSIVVLDLTLTSVGIAALNQPERNPLIGRNPSHARLWTLGLTGAASHVLIARLLPRDLRDGWQAFGISIEIAACVGNGAILIGGSF